MADPRLITGSNVVLSVFKDDWQAYLCYTSITISVTADLVDTRTSGDGHWRKVAIKRVGWTMVLSGALINTGIEDDDFQGWDFFRRMKGLTDVVVRATFTDDNGDIRSVQGQAAVDTTTFTVGINQPVKDDINITGNGQLMEFDGIVPCDSQVTGATVNNLADPDGNITITPNVAGVAAQVKYRLDNLGSYSFAAVGTDLSFAALPIDDHSVEIIPVCGNGYEGEGYTANFTVNHGLTCAATPIITFAVNGKSANITFSDSTPGFRFRFDGGPWYNRIASDKTINWNGLQGTHNLEVQARCANNAYGDKVSQQFTVPDRAGAAVVTFSYSELPELENDSYLDGYIDGVRVYHQTTHRDMDFTILPGQTVRAVLHSKLISPLRIRGVELKVYNRDTTEVLSDQVFVTPQDFTYTFTADGDNYVVQATIGS